MSFGINIKLQKFRLTPHINAKRKKRMWPKIKNKYKFRLKWRQNKSSPRAIVLMRKLKIKIKVKIQNHYLFISPRSNLMFMLIVSEEN